ncbi:50S ribosomal protein L25 [Desulfobacterales bacterium HSG17]|nr:50S ribosomal protein L25 [Desulfobacterales bacterium HSG17]
MELLDLKASVRTATGNSPARALRRDGKIPAILYGPDTKPVKLAIITRELEDAMKKSKSSQMLLNLVVENGEKAGHMVMLKDLQIHPVKRSFIHADFYEVSMDRKIKVMVPVTTKGKCIGVELGGMLQVIRRELEALCFPNDIPESVEIDVTDMDAGDSVHIEDISIEGVEFPADVNFTVLTVLSGKVKDEDEEGEEGEEDEVTEEAEAAAE